ncbi:hypothetical protein [Superficieibacter sp.]|uniref:hypothetical protein n=1 Tax=Superficieibacter sp. TaxID=2303322 RepID=UPI0028B054C9|nr:hypothetical protein [Superficieibacter sp.]
MNQPIKSELIIVAEKYQSDILYMLIEGNFPAPGMGIMLRECTIDNVRVIVAARDYLNMKSVINIFNDDGRDIRRKFF